MNDNEELKEGYAEGGNIPGTEVPKPVGGGYGQYGGTGRLYTQALSLVHLLILTQVER